MRISAQRRRARSCGGISALDVVVSVNVVPRLVSPVGGMWRRRCQPGGRGPCWAAGRMTWSSTRSTSWGVTLSPSRILGAPAAQAPDHRSAAAPGRHGALHLHGPVPAVRTLTHRRATTGPRRRPASDEPFRARPPWAAPDVSRVRDVSNPLVSRFWVRGALDANRGPRRGRAVAQVCSSSADVHIDASRPSCVNTVGTAVERDQHAARPVRAG